MLWTWSWFFFFGTGKRERDDFGVRVALGISSYEVGLMGYGRSC